MSTPRIFVRRRWIASSNAEWCWSTNPDGGGERGGRTVAAAVTRAEEAHPEIRERGVTIIVEPDDTADQVRRAHDAFFGRG